MTPPSQRRRRSAPAPARRSRPPARSSSQRRPFVGLWLLCGLLYAAVGVIIVALAPPWVWLVAVAGALVQSLALAGPQTLQRFRWLAANLVVLGSILGGTALAVAISIALNHLGVNNLDELAIGRAVIEVALYSLLAALLAVLCSLVTTTLGDRLLRRYQGRTITVVLLGTCLLGLAIGGALGMLIAPA
ncbi:hypothetical protein [Nodosilinea sp. E11]|uniref:hypothetical protein n=1 Tax=Nodosilinea sp. E11 TaxID=3037479 RepID=UPI002934F432|nr:hypothetical protein [Nodosilinea sp. E11]WOD40788.1 hypothetical protein RRF56_08270 [Nodosilinea sp. E11]